MQKNPSKRLAPVFRGNKPFQGLDPLPFLRQIPRLPHNPLPNEMSEAEEQKTVVAYCDAIGVPVYHIPNERKCSPQAGAHLKAQGLRPGVPDLCIPVPRGKYSALYIEMKAEGGKISEAQEEWIYKLRKYGNAACVCFGADSAITLIDLYLQEKIEFVTPTQE